MTGKQMSCILEGCPGNLERRAIKTLATFTQYAKFDVSLKTLFKEELHNRFNLISEERVKYFKYNSENLMKIG